MSRLLYSKLSMVVSFLVLVMGLALHSTAAGQTPGVTPIRITLQNALERARTNSQPFQSATIAAELAHEDRVQARAALLPSVNYINQFIYTEPNGTPSGVFVANDGPHIYNRQAVVHAGIFAPGKRTEP